MPDWTKDNAAGRLILQHHGLEVFESSLHLEGGSIHTDGEGCAPPSPQLNPFSYTPILATYPFSVCLKLLFTITHYLESAACVTV